MNHQDRSCHSVNILVTHHWRSILTYFAFGRHVGRRPMSPLPPQGFLQVLVLQKRQRRLSQTHVLAFSLSDTRQDHPSREESGQHFSHCFC